MFVCCRVFASLLRNVIQVRVVLLISIFKFGGSFTRDDAPKLWQTHNISCSSFSLFELEVLECSRVVYFKTLIALAGAQGVKRIAFVFPGESI